MSFRFREKTVFVCQIFLGIAKYFSELRNIFVTQVPHREAALRHAAHPGEEQRGRPLPGPAVGHRPGRGAADSELSGETLQGGQVGAGQVQLQLPGKVRERKCFY